MTANPTPTAQQPTEAEYEAYLAEQEAVGEAAYAAYLADYEPPEAAAADDWPEPDDDDLVSTRTWIRRHTVSDRDVANLTRELDAVEDSFRNEDVLIGYALSGDDVADRAKLDRSTAPYLRYLAARAGAVVDRIDGKYVGWVDAERLEPVRERALELANNIEDEAAFVEKSREFGSLGSHCAMSGDGHSAPTKREAVFRARVIATMVENGEHDARRYSELAALADRVRSEHPDLAERYDISADVSYDDTRYSSRPHVYVGDGFEAACERYGAPYAVLESRVKELHAAVLSKCGDCRRNITDDFACGECGFKGLTPLPDAFTAIEDVIRSVS